MWNILVVDDDRGVGYAFQRVFKTPDYTVEVALSAADALEKVRSTVYDLIILDIQMPGMSGLEALQHIQKIDPNVPVIFITAFGTADTAIEAMRRGAYDFILKPFDIPAMKQLVDRALALSRQMRTQVVLETPPDVRLNEDRMVGLTPQMQEVYKQIGQVAATDVPVLIRGESGTGKELVARAIYQHSRRLHKPFLTINCAAIPETLLESELFGYEKGAFTGAVQRRIGKFEQADGGTVFLDEIGDMELTTQTKVLRLLQEQTFERLGGNTTIQVDVRVIAATNRPLEHMIEEKRFREDLYYRLNVVTLTLPPLRERRDDIPRLAEYFLARFRAELGKPDLALSKEALDLLLSYDWPGNIRELQNVLKHAILMTKGHRILPESLSIPPSVKTPLSHTTSTFFPFSKDDLDNRHTNLYETVIPEVERRLILYALSRTNGNQVKAAQLLGISRMMLRSRMARYGITVEMAVDEAC
jgi:two-component system nitrogen regulation response regulator GlnG